MDIGELRNFLYELLLIDSYEYEELAIKFVKDYIEGLGDFNIEVQNVSGKAFNLILNPAEEAKFVVATHIDTIPKKTTTEILDENFIKGTGAVDAKASIASIVYTLSNLRDLPEKVSFVILSGEEKDSAGCSKYLEKFHPSSALILEPSKLDIFFGSIGYVEANVIVTGYSSHPDFSASSRAFDKINPIEKFYQWLDKLKNACNKVSCKPILLNLSTDGDIYTTPSTLNAKINIVIGEGSSVKKIFETIRSIELDDVSVTFEDGSDPFRTNDQNFISLLQDTYRETFNREPRKYLYPAWTDATLFHEKGIPVAIFGPGDYSLAHTVDEKIDIREIVEASRFLSNLIRKV